MFLKSVHNIIGDQAIFQRAVGDEYHDDDEQGYILPVGTLPQQQHQQHEQGQQQQAEGVAISDLSSWGSSEDGESLGMYNFKRRFKNSSRLNSTKQL